MKKKINYCALSVLLLITVFTSCRKNDPTFDELQKVAPSKKMDVPSTTSAISNQYFDIDSIGRNIQFVSESPTANSERIRLALSKPQSDYYPTGFFLAPFDTLKINTEVIQGTALPKLLIGTMQLYPDINPQIVQLKPGENKIVANKNGGIIWVAYNGSPVPSGKTKLTFLSGHKLVPVFIKNTTTLSEWQAKLDQADAVIPHVLLIGQRVNMVVTRTIKELKTQNNNSVLDAADRIWDAEDSLSGLDPAQRLGTPHLMVHRSYQEGGAWYFVTSYTYASYFTEGYTKDSWIQRHEIGHMHQQYWDFHPQVVADFFAISLGIDWGLPQDKIGRYGGWVGIWPKVRNYFNKPDSLKDYSLIWDKGDRFAAAAMLIQLKLTFGNALYTELHKQTRAEQPKLSSPESKYRYFMVKACTISNKDLTKFFKKWGLKNDLAYQEIAGLNLPEPDIDPSTKTDDPTFVF